MALPRTLRCPEGGSVTCSILKIVDEIGRAPGDFQWWASIWVPAIAAAASVGVLIFSLITARSAKKQAEDSEEARKAAERARSENERQQRFNAGLVNLLDALPEFMEGIRAYNRGQRQIERALHANRTPRGRPPAFPSTSQVIVRVNAAKLEGNRDDRRMLSRVRNVILVRAGVEPLALTKKLAIISDMFVVWRHGSESKKSEILAALLELKDAKTVAECVALGNRLRSARVVSDSASEQ